MHIIEFDCSGVRLKLCSPRFVMDGLVCRSKFAHSRVGNIALENIFVLLECRY